MATYPCVPSGAQGRCGGFRGLGGDTPLPHPGDESGMSPVNCVERNGGGRSRRMPIPPTVDGDSSSLPPDPEEERRDKDKDRRDEPVAIRLIDGG